MQEIWFYLWINSVKTFTTYRCTLSLIYIESLLGAYRNIVISVKMVIM